VNSTISASLRCAFTASELRTMEGQSHAVDPTVLSSVLVEFFAAD
jgi:hypothetical protein